MKNHTYKSSDSSDGTVECIKCGLRSSNPYDAKSGLQTIECTPQYGLDCSYYDKTFDSINELISEVIISGMDPNYEITKDGVLTGEILADLI